MRASSASATIPNYLSISLGAGDTTVAKLVNAYAILANQGRAVKPTMIDYVQDRTGKVIYRTDNRCQVMGNCNAADWDGKGMPRPPSRDRQLLDPMAAFQMVHILEGVVERGTATVLRDLDRPLFGKTGTTSRPNQCLVRRRNARSRCGRLYRLRPAAQHGRLCPGRTNRRADLQGFCAGRLQGHAEGPVRRASGHSLGAHRPGQRPPRIRRVPGPGGPQVGGHLGGVPAADRAAAFPPVASRSECRVSPVPRTASDDPARSPQLQRRPRVVRARQPQRISRRRRLARSGCHLLARR